MISQFDKEKLEAAQQAVDLAQQSVTELYKAEDQMLAEHAYDIMEPLGKISKKLQRLLSVTKTSSVKP
jgi:hypothetical protein